MITGSLVQIYFHVILSPEIRCPFESEEMQKRLFTKITNILLQLKHKPVAVNGMYDHVHILADFHPKIGVEDTINKIKDITEKYLQHEEGLAEFGWQTGYGAFSYGLSEVRPLRNYILDQKFHHLHKTFREEYIELLKEFDVAFKMSELFDFHE
jgi:putative transposase